MTPSFPTQLSFRKPSLRFIETILVQIYASLQHTPQYIERTKRAKERASLFYARQNPPHLHQPLDTTLLPPTMLFPFLFGRVKKKPAQRTGVRTVPCYTSLLSLHSLSLSPRHSTCLETISRFPFTRFFLQLFGLPRFHVTLVVASGDLALTSSPVPDFPLGKRPDRVEGQQIESWCQWASS